MKQHGVGRTPQASGSYLSITSKEGIREVLLGQQMGPGMHEPECQGNKLDFSCK